MSMIPLKRIQFIHNFKIGRGKSMGFIDTAMKMHRSCKLLALDRDMECVAVMMDNDFQLIPIHGNVKYMAPVNVPSDVDCKAIMGRGEIEQPPPITDEELQKTVQKAVEAEAKTKAKKKPGRKPKK